MKVETSLSASVKIVLTILITAVVSLGGLYIVSQDKEGLPGYYVPLAFILSGFLFILLFAQAIWILVKYSRSSRQLQTTGVGESEARQANLELIRHVSHKIRTPLNTLTSSIELLNSSELMDFQKEPISIMGSSLDAIHVLINDIVDSTIINSDGIKLNPEMVSMNEFLESLYSGIRPLAEANGLLLDFNWPKDEKLGISMDPLRLRQVLYNVLYNFISYNDQGMVSLKVDPEYEEDDSVILRFIVKGQQIGMDEEELSRFHEFVSNLSEPIQDRLPFLDLGLYIGTAIIQSMGGKMEVGRTKEKNEICLIIAVRTQLHCSTGNKDLATDTASSEDTNEVQRSAAHTRLTRALIVDDIPVNRFMMKKVIDSLGIATDQANNGKEALEAVQKTNYELILMDITMPVMDGIEATRRIRSTELEKQPVIIAVTANAVDLCKEQSMDAGMDSFIAKPFKLDQIKSILENYFDLDMAGKPRIKLK